MMDSNGKKIQVILLEILTLKQNINIRLGNIARPIDYIGKLVKCVELQMLQ